MPLKPNAILSFPDDFDPTEEKVVITAKRVTEPTYEVVSTAIIEKKKSGSPRSVALQVMLATAALLLLFVGAAMYMNEAPPLSLPAQIIRLQELLPEEVSEPEDRPPAVTEEEREAEPVAQIARRTTKKRTSRKAKASKKPNPCDPPFWIDHEGLRRLKPGCD